MASDGDHWLGFVGLYAIANVLLILFSAMADRDAFSAIYVLWFFTWCGPPCLLFMLALVAFCDGLKWRYWVVSVVLACGAFAVNLVFLHDAIGAA